MSSIACATPITDLNINILTPPYYQGKDLNFQATWTGSDANVLYWNFETDQNVTNGTLSQQTFYSNDFSSQSITDWNIISGTWSAASSNLKGTAASGEISKNLGSDANWLYTGVEVQFVVDAFNIAVGIYDGNSDATGTGYQFTTASSELKVKVNTAGSLVEILAVGGTINPGDTLRYKFDINGLITVYQNGAIYATVTDTNYHSIDHIVVSNSTQNAAIDDILVRSLIAPTSRIQTGASQTYSYSTSGAKTVYLTTQNLDGNTTTSLDFTVLADTNGPVLEVFDINSITGFGVVGKFNYELRCTDDFSSTIDYNLSNNGVSLYSSTDANNTTVYLNNSQLNNGVNLITFTCTDGSGNSTSDTNSITGASALFYLVNTETGVGLTGSADYVAADINSFRVYSSSLNQYIDLYATGDVNVNYSGLGDDSVTFIPTYTNSGTKTSGKQYFDMSALDVNSVPVCFSNIQPFYEQLIYSTTARQVKIRNQLTGCYLAMAYDDYAYADGVSISVFTIPGTYELSYRPEDSNSYTLLSLLAGDFAASHNLDLMIINKQSAPDVVVSSDTLTVSRYCQVVDCNVLAVKYVSVEPNTSVTVQILKGTTILTSSTGTGADANTFSFTWDFTLADVNSDYLTVRAIITRNDGTQDTITQLFTLRGIQGFLDPNLAIIIAFGIFFFIFTVVASRYALGWVGIIGVILALAILSTAPGTQIVLLAQAIFITIGVVIFFTWKNETAKAI